MKITFLLSLALLAAGAFWLVQTSRAATETPKYKVLRADGAFEMREYPALALVKAPMIEDGQDGSFGRLFRYISGENESEKKIAMTTPVLIDRTVGQASMSFIVPISVAEKGAPEAKDRALAIAAQEPARFAALRFEGKGTSEQEQAAVSKLREWMASQGLPSASEPLIAYYDPPWTPASLRRNEILIRIGGS
jgi:hypothetical protein